MDGRAVVTMQIKNSYKPIYKDASILLRPKTGLKDMILQLDPGTKAAGDIEEGGSVSVANTLPDVNADEVLASLDADTRAYVGILVNAGGTALRDDTTPTQQGAPADLRETFKRFEPTARDAKRLTGALSSGGATSGGRSTRSSSCRPSWARRTSSSPDWSTRPIATSRRSRRSSRACARRCSCSRARCSRRPRRWSTSRASPTSSGRRSRACGRSRASWPRRCDASSRSCATPRRSSATRSVRSRATRSRP